MIFSLIITIYLTTCFGSLIFHYQLESFVLIASQNAEGNIEYKRHLVCEEGALRFEQLATQLKWRLGEGDGCATYRLGVDDDGTLSGLEHTAMERSLRILYAMAHHIGATLSQVSLYDVTAVPKLKLPNSEFPGAYLQAAEHSGSADDSGMDSNPAPNGSQSQPRKKSRRKRHSRCLSGGSPSASSSISASNSISASAYNSHLLSTLPLLASLHLQATSPPPSVPVPPNPSASRLVADVLVRTCRVCPPGPASTSEPTEVRLAFIGAADAGKSTLIGILYMHSYCIQKKYFQCIQELFYVTICVTIQLLTLHY